MLPVQEDEIAEPRIGEMPTTQSEEINQLSLLWQLLDEQQQLTAVDRFAQVHADETLPVQAKYYSALIPATPPGEGQQYAFEVDLDACSGCKACVTACHSLNGLDEQETWRDVGLLHGGTDKLPVLQHVTSSCHHCLEPPCMNVCPVDAYDKDPVTGIVKHLDDQCIGCQYCTLACPYDAPKYQPQKGIVRKCDMCSDRLTAGEAPACVQACPHEAIRITIVNRDDVIADSETNLFLPGAHEPQYTLPTTNYKSSKPLPRNLLPADYYSATAEHAHWPLVLMLVLTQLSVGAFLVEFLLDVLLDSQLLELIRPVHSVSAVTFGILALGASTCHLGRPRYAFRAVIGLKHSWLSREILAFGIFAPLAVAYAGSIWWPISAETGSLTESLGAAVVATGLAGVVCSIMVYQCTRRLFWSGFYTSFKFLATTLLLGISTALVTSMLAAASSSSVATADVMTEFATDLCRGLIAVTALKLLFEAGLFRHLRQTQNTPLKRSAMLMAGELSNATLARFGCGFLGGIWLPGMLLSYDWQSTTAESSRFLPLLAVLVCFAASLAGELLERYLFFAAVVRPKMPGGLSP